MIRDVHLAVLTVSPSTCMNRIKRKAAQEKANTESTPKLRAYVRSGTTEGTKPVVNRRRELYDEVVAMKNATVKRVLRYERGTRASRPDKELFSAQLAASCENRVKHLRGESTEQMAALEENSQQVHDEAQIMEKWDPARRIRAWNHHRCAVCSVLNKRHWWQTKLAGDERDIRRVVVAKSPWEDEKNIWVWPRSESDHQKDDTDSARSPFSVSSWPSMEIQRFLFGDNGMEAPQDQLNRPVSDDEASEWWRAHCTQSHLATNGTLIIEKPYSAEFSSNVSNEGDVFPVCTSEVVANRDLYKLQEQAKRAARTRSLERDVEQRIKDLTTQVERRVHEMEVQVEANTQLALEILQRKKEQRARISREQQASMTIQRYARGMQGRKCAREVRAEFFVLVRGRAIRRGRCEECGDQRAVLECQQCEESLHFCPICWVHVHSTRRRKTHVAIPMATVVAPTPVQEAESTKSSTMKESTADSSQAKVVSIEENLVPSLRSLPSPPKQSTTRSAEPARVKLKKPVIDTKNRSANSSKQGDIRSTALAKVAGTRKSTTPELTEACALARHVRVEIQEALSTTEEHDFVPVRKPGAVKATEGVPVQSPRGTTIQEADEVDFSTVQGDGAMVSEFEIGQDEQQAQTPIETAAETEQPVSLLPESICVPEPEESSNDHNSPPDASTSAGISNIDTATATSVEQESAHNADLSVNAGNCTETTEVPSEEANGDTDNVSGSAIAGVAVVAADPSASNDALPSTEQSEVTEQDIDAGTVAAEVVTAPEDPPPSGRSAEAPSQQDS